MRIGFSPVGDRCSRYARGPGPVAGLRVHVAAWVAGQKRVTDEEGRAVFPNLRPESYSVEVRDPDFVWSQVAVELRPGEERTLDFVEPAGWTPEATVVDSKDRPVPFASVEVESRAPVPYLRVEGGIQDLALYTDANGRIWLPEMHHATATLTVRYGSRKKIEWVEESEPSVTVRLPPP
jgi:hypothetical protein